ncbi:hypothetical protein RB625_03615 [Streptomyces californicus]|nr:hypothetical protein [Streptomyces californicus]
MAAGSVVESVREARTATREAEALSEAVVIPEAVAVPEAEAFPAVPGAVALRAFPAEGA